MISSAHEQQRLGDVDVSSFVSQWSGHSTEGRPGIDDLETLDAQLFGAFLQFLIGAVHLGAANGLRRSDVEAVPLPSPIFADAVKFLVRSLRFCFIPFGIFSRRQIFQFSFSLGRRESYVLANPVHLCNSADIAVSVLGRGTNSIGGNSDFLNGDDRCVNFSSVVSQLFQQPANLSPVFALLRAHFDED
jgi:hypothetical protein